MEYHKPMSTPMVTGCTLSLDDDSRKVDQTMYRSMVGSLLYETTTRPDIIKVVGLIGGFQCATKETYLNAVKIIFIYLRSYFGFWIMVSKNKIFYIKCIH
jgi:hypothetical protein